jgi:hypothetical protein
VEDCRANEIAVPENSILRRMRKRMNSNVKNTIACLGAVLLVSGCKKTADNTSNYKSAIDAYYSASPVCLWSQPQQFPTQIAASNTDQAAPFAALVDQGLLTRTTSEKKIIIISKQEVNYDLSDKGRSAWTADPNQPGYGNFCYGHRTVQTINSATPNNGQPGATAQVSYNYSFSGAPDWAKAAETQNAFPNTQSNLSGGTANATLVDTNNGWQVQAPSPSAQPASSQPATPADGKIVQ